MKFTLSWLKDHLDTDTDARTVAETLTRIGLEVESIENPAERLAPFIIAKVLTADRHPQANKLQILTVDTGSGEPAQVVCGAPNARAGLKGVFGGPGTYVPGSDITLKIAAIRGVESRGMMCSVRELELGDEHDGIIELSDEAPVGAPFAAWAGLDDPIIDIAITPNRQDCMGVYGIARDLAAAGLGKLKPIDIQPIEGTFPCPIEIRTDAPDACPAFYGRVIRGVRNGPSPDWLRRRLEAVGQRSISLLVDLTNYIMLAYGRPLHVYDLAKLEGGLTARLARKGEQVLALNGRTYALDEGICVIADENAVHDIGGIMGGEHSSVTEFTTDIVIECAYFDPEHIARAGQKLGISSDARTRFERGVDPAFLDRGLAIFTHMALDLAGGEASKAVRAGAPPAGERTVEYAPSMCLSLAGMDVAEEKQAELLSRLGIDVRRSDPWQLSIPTWRRDIGGPADIVEEITRLEGLDKLPSTPLVRAPGVAKPTATPQQMLERKIRRTAASRGLNEAVTWSFISTSEADAFGGSAWILENPISEEMKAMRPSLIPGLLAAARRNKARGATTIRLFELGRRYFAEAERPTLGLILAGERSQRHWRTGKAQDFDAFDAKAEAMAILAAAGAPVENLQVLAGTGAAYHPGRSARLCMGSKNVLAEFGELHPKTLRQFDISGPVMAAEIFLDALPQKRTSDHMRQTYAPPALQAVSRDFAFIVPADLEADKLLRAIRGADKAAIASINLFDIFAGSGIPEGHKSLAIEVTLQPGEKSFTDDELKAISERIVAAAAKLGARLRD